MNSLHKTISKSFITFSFLFLLIFEGCTSDKYNYFTKEDLPWMVYLKGDSLKFANNSGQIRTYFVSDLRRGYENSGGTNNEHESATITLKNDTSVNHTNGFLYMVKTGSGLEISAGWPYYPVTFYPLQLTVANDTVSGVVYTDVYISKTSDTASDVVEVHYSKTKGFILFKQSSGKVWSITN